MPSPAATLAPAPNQALIDAAEAGDLARVRTLLAQGASPAFADGRGITALIAAAYANRVDIAQVLIDAGADVNAQDRTRQSAYLISTSDGFADLLRLTLRHGADVGSTDSYNGTGLIRAADRGHVEVIRELLKTNIAIDHVNRLGWTALLEAVILGDGGTAHTTIVGLLVQHGADVNRADAQGVTPLAHAERRGQRAIADILRRAPRRPVTPG